MKAEADRFHWTPSTRFRELPVLSGREGSLAGEQGLGHRRPGFYQPPHQWPVALPF